MANDGGSLDDIEEGSKTLVNIEIGPPKYNAAVSEKARRAINVTDLGYEKGEYADKVVLQGELEVTEVYRKQL